MLVAFQAGQGIRDVSDAYRRRGHDITLHRHNRSADQMSDHLAAAGFVEVARLERAAAPHERDDQDVLIAS